MAYTEDLKEYFSTNELKAAVMTPEEEFTYLEIIHLACDEDGHCDDHNCPARDEFIERNMRLVLHVVKRFMTLKDPKVMEAVSAGTMGLIRGVDRFNIFARNASGKPYRFSTYAVWWIQSFIRDELVKHDHKIVGHTSYHAQFKKAAKELMRVSGDPEVTQAAVLDYLRDHYGWSDKKVSKYLIDHDNHIVPVSSIADPPVDEADPVRHMLRNESHSLINKALSELSFQEEYLLMSHYVEGQTYDEIKVTFGVSRERVRQLENEALRKLYTILAPQVKGLRQAI